MRRRQHAAALVEFALAWPIALLLVLSTVEAAVWAAEAYAAHAATVAGAHEVEREADALQVQARSAAAIIVSLPVAFLLVLSALRSPYLDAFHQPAGEAFLLLMLAVMGASYVWMRRLLRLDGLQRVRLVDA